MASNSTLFPRQIQMIVRRIVNAVTGNRVERRTEKEMQCCDRGGAHYIGIIRGKQGKWAKRDAIIFSLDRERGSKRLPWVSYCPSVLPLSNGHSSTDFSQDGEKEQRR